MNKSQILRNTICKNKKLNPLTGKDENTRPKTSVFHVNSPVKGLAP